MTVTEQLSRPEPTGQIASRVVNECLQVKPDEQVTIFTWDHTLDYASHLAVEVEKTGGVATTTLMTNDFYWSYLKDMPLRQYARKQKGNLALLDQTDAVVNLAGPKDPAQYQSVPSERTSKMLEGGQQINNKFVEKKIRTLNLPIGLITPERAKTYGFNHKQWLDNFNKSLNVDHAKIASLAKKLATRLEKARDIHITSRNGTDLKLQLKGRPVHVHDGILDKADIDNGTFFEALPSGVIELVPDETFAEGTVVFDQPTAIAGKMIHGLAWPFHNGHLTKYDAAENLETFRGLYEGATGDKDRVGDVAVGLNPAAELIGFNSDRIVQGVVSVGIGGNKGNGGDNDSSWGTELSLRKPTMEIDGSRIIVDGKIMI